jgi:hypothetical protein
VKPGKYGVIAVLVIGSTTAASFSDFSYDRYLEEVREFQAWKIQ